LNLYGVLVRKAGICLNSETKPITVDKYKTLTIGSKSYLFEVNSEIGDDKIVTVYKIVPLESSGWKTDWEIFSESIINNNRPIFNVSGSLYLPSAETNILTDFGLSEYDYEQSSATIYPENVVEIEPAVYNGTYILDGKLLFASQELVGEDQREITLKLENYLFIPYYSKIELSKKIGSVVFAVKIYGKVYTIDAGFSSLFNKLVSLTLKEQGTNKIIIQKYFKIGDVKYLYLDGYPLMIEFLTNEVVKDNKKVQDPVILISRP
jgi:hypothetical protein